MSCIYNPLCEAVGVCSSVAVRLADEDEGTWWPGTARREGWRREFAWFDAGGSRLTLERRNRSGEVERLVLLDSIRCAGAHSSFLLNTAEGSGDLAGEQTSALIDTAARLNKQRRPWYEGKTRKGSKDGWAPEVKYAPGMPKERNGGACFCFFSITRIVLITEIFNPEQRDQCDDE